MTASTVLSTILDLPMPAKVPPVPLEKILSASGEIFMGVFDKGGDRPAPDVLRFAVERAEAFLASCSTEADALREAMEGMPVQDIGGCILRFVSAWPNASGGDLAGYGAQLAQDVIDRTPCRYAVNEALRHLRHTSRFLPSIADTLSALDEAQKRIRNTSWHIANLPVELEKARSGFDPKGGGRMTKIGDSRWQN